MPAVGSHGSSARPVRALLLTGWILVVAGCAHAPQTRQLLADATGLPVEITECPEPVLLGSAMLGAVAGGVFADLATAMPAMSRIAATCAPDSGTRALQDARYRAFVTLQRTAREIRAAI